MGHTFNPPSLSFIVAGMSKCGTTSLCSLLSQHSDICFASTKEPNFFSLPDYDQQWPWYSSLFTGQSTASLLGEGSTFYSSAAMEALSRERILTHYPEIKLIFIFRDPLARFRSSFREYHHSGPNFGIDAAFTLAGVMRQFPALLDDTYYLTRLKNYTDFVSPNNIQVLFLEDLQESPLAVAQQCFDFLQIDHCAVAEHRLNEGEEKLQDSRLLRRMRNTKMIGPALSVVDVETQNRWFQRLRLRKKFVQGSVEWGDIKSLSDEIEKVVDESEQLLEQYGKPASLWPGLGLLMKQLDSHKL